ncbi:MAG: AraC family transcriptional regulator [Eubacteriales bacterium]|nr:AraC family transcriptional regulator [Eubacteriales bacterium]
MDYRSVTLASEIEISRIVTIHYFEYMSDFIFEGESHNFWEFLCVDKGEVEVMADSRKYVLKKDEIIFHKPNEFHSLKANGVIAPNLVVVSFYCLSPAMNFFCDKVLTVTETERMLLAQILQDAVQTFSCKLDDPYLKEMTRNAEIPVGSEQLIRIHLEELLIRLLRRYSAVPFRSPAALPRPRGRDTVLYHGVYQYLEQHLYDKLTIDKICHDNLIGRSHLQKLFRERHGCGVIDQFSRMKIEAAKQLMRDNKLNFTQISDTLGYTSVHYFSRQFKKISGMTPSEYVSSIKVLAEKPEAEG